MNAHIMAFISLRSLIKQKASAKKLFPAFAVFLLIVGQLGVYTRVLADEATSTDVQEEIVEEPVQSEQTGSIRVCKVIIDENGVAGDGSGSTGGTFTLSGVMPSPETSQGAPIGVLPVSTFSTSLSLNSDLFAAFEGNDAECVTYSELAIGGYYYGEENVTGDNWSDPKYNDQFNTSIETIDDFFAYDGKLFDGDSSNDGTRNENADGHILLLSDRPDRTLVVLNRFTIPTPPPPSVTQCNDGEDNDGDELVDLNDPGCVDANDNDETNVIDEQNGGDNENNGGNEDNSTNNSSNNSGGGGGGGNGSPFIVSQNIGGPAAPQGGQVLGVSTSTEAAGQDGQVLGESCGVYLDDYIKFGAHNNPDQVKKLQVFLNKHMNTTLPISGFYGTLTRDAVNAFQLKYASEVLEPWVTHGLPNTQTPTGYVYKTTKRWINMIECPALNLEVPPLP